MNDAAEKVVTYITPAEPETLFVNDAELIRRSGVPEKIMRDAIKFWDTKKCGFPQKVESLGGRRYWPDVKAYLEREARRKMGVPQPMERTYVSGR